MKNKANYAIIFLIIGAIAFIAAGVSIAARNERFKNGGIRSVATITEISYSYDSDGDYTTNVYVRFTAESGETVTGKLDAYYSGMHEGDEIPVLYLKNDPSQFIYAKLTLVPVIICFVSGIILIVAAFFSLRPKIKSTRLENIKRNGTLVSAEIRDVYVCSKVRFLQKYLTKLTCVDYGGTEYTSWVTAQSEDCFALGDRIDVYVAANNPAKFVIDTESYQQAKSYTIEKTDDS